MKRASKKFTMSTEAMLAHQQRNNLPVHPSLLSIARNSPVNPQSAAEILPSAKSGEIQSPAKRGKQSHEIDHHGKLPNPKPKRNKAATLDRTVSGEASCIPRVTVRFIGYRVRPLDPDNFAGSVKDLLDGLRHASLIHGDEPWRIKLETEQVKVRTKSQEKTVIEIEQ